MHNIKTYLIHGPDSSREQRMITEFNLANMDLSGITWLRYPNKNEIDVDFINKCVSSRSNLLPWEYKIEDIPRGVVSCTYKHYLALKDIVENKYDYGIIMEDNFQFIKGINIPERINIYINQLNKYYPEWDILFDLKNGPPSDYNTYTDDIYVYPRKHTHENPWHGGARCASFYIVTYNCALKLYNNYLPFNSAPDAWMCDLFRKLDIKCFWAEPNVVEPWPHTSTAVT